MVTIILAAGYGTRLYPLTLDKPKAFLDVGGMTILDRLVGNIERVKECSSIIIVTNEKFYDDFDSWLDAGHHREKIELLSDGTTSNKGRIGAIGDINLVLTENKIDDDLLITGSDNLFKLELADFVKFGREKKPFSSIMLFDVKDKKQAAKYGVCSLNKDFRVTDFEEKPSSPKSTLAATAVYFIPKEKAGKIFDYMKTDLSKDAPGNLMKWLAKEDRLFGYVLDKAWFDIGSVESLKKADKEFSR